MWRYRLMTLTASGRVHEKVSGNRGYLWTQAQQAREARGRQWIERSDQPAHIVPSAAYRISQRVLRRAD